MRYNYLLTFIILIALFGPGIGSLNGQSINIPESIIVRKTDNFGLITDYTVQAKNTLYSICKFYDCELGELKRYNPNLDLAVLEPGQTLNIPFKKNLIVKEIRGGNQPQYLPVYYKTSKKDNLFRISRIYFDQEISSIKELNKLNGHDLQPDQLLLVGWIKRSIFTGKKIEIQEEKDKIEQVTVTETEDTPATDDNRMVFIKKLDKTGKITGIKDTSQFSVKTKHIVQQNGLAIWNKTSNASGSFALHNDAKTGTLLEIINPLLNRKSYVKVIGKIPGNTYQDNVKVILSPEAAKTLGALDSRFYVRMNYITE